MALRVTFEPLPSAPRAGRALDAGALPTLHDRYGLSTDAVVARVLTELL